MLIDPILKELVDKKGSDIHLRIGRPPLMRTDGELLPTEHPVMTRESMDAILHTLLGEVGIQRLNEKGDQDAAYCLPDVGRFRVNCMRYMGNYGVVVRAIPLKIPTIEELSLPPVLKDIVKAPQGLILVTGPTGSGKSTTMAAMINVLNETEPLHIVTIEDPIEFVYEDRLCTHTQRQLGADTPSLHEALKRALRQDPDVILMGEMRDRETIEFGMHAAETGHLVFSTLHTNDAKQTMDRILDAFPGDASKQVRGVLSLTLHSVISQRLVRRIDGKGRYAVLEILVNSPQVRDLVHEGKTGDLDKAMKTGSFYGMQTFNQHLASMVKEMRVSEEDAVAVSTNPSDLKLLLRGITGANTGMPMQTEAAAAPATPAGTASDTKTKFTKGFKF